MGATFTAHPSRFLLDIPEGLCKVAPGVEVMVGPPVSPASQGLDLGEILGEALASKPKVEFKIGDKVRHEKFGEGIVVQIEERGDDAIVTVAFPDRGEIKRLSLRHAPLEKL